MRLELAALITGRVGAQHRTGAALVSGTQASHGLRGYGGGMPPRSEYLRLGSDGRHGCVAVKIQSHTERRNLLPIGLSCATAAGTRTPSSWRR